MTKRRLRYGYTTGACATAAAKGAAAMLRRQQLLEEVELVLPRGETARFLLHGQQFDAATASCYVVKDAGDDPDITHGAELHVTVRRETQSRPRQTLVFVSGGPGIGRVTKPGLAVAPGEWAINPVPRQMIVAAVQGEFAGCLPESLSVTVSIPDGAARAEKTLNARLGIVGGLSILGTTGIVTPISAKAWTDTIDVALDVAKAAGCATVVLATGRTSELAAREHFAAAGTPLAEEGVVLMGDHVAHALQAAAAGGFATVVLAAQFAKLVKIAAGHPQTHAANATLEMAELAGWLRSDPAAASLVPLAAQAPTARHLLLAAEAAPALLEVVAERARQAALTVAPGLPLKVLLAGYAREVLYCR